MRTGLYGDVKGVASDDLVRMRRRVYTRGDKRVDTLDHELRAAKSEKIRIALDLGNSAPRKSKRDYGKGLPEHSS